MSPRGADIRLPGQHMSTPSVEPEVHKHPTMDPILSQMNPIHGFYGNRAGGCEQDSYGSG
jgi:hypothetical protein